jgi:ferredoxin
LYRSRLSIKLSAEVTFSASILSQSSLSAYVMRTTTDFAGFDRDNSSANGLKLGEVQWTGDLKPTKLEDGCEVDISWGVEGGLAFTLGIGPDLKFFSRLSKFNDVATLTAPNIELEAPISLNIGGNDTCDTCNRACPSGVVSFIPSVTVGVKVRLLPLRLLYGHSRTVAAILALLLLQFGSQWDLGHSTFQLLGTAQHSNRCISCT